MISLLERYDRPAPRYTSYPPAPHWKDGAGPELLTGALAGSSRPLSVYVHIPFCERLCLYCGCNVRISRDHSVAAPYLADLDREIELLDVAHGRPVTQIHWGGGTPTYLRCAEIESLYNSFRRRLEIQPDSEISVEIDPRVTSGEQLRLLSSLGFNRLSVGVQDFDRIVQEAIHRFQPFEQTRGLIGLARQLGFESVNVDLIYGLPFQSVSSFSKTVDLVLKLNPDRIALFSYAHVPALKKQQTAIARHLPAAVEKLNIFMYASNRFADAGYQNIGIDHFAKAGDPLSLAKNERTLHRNFQGYTTHAETDLLGFGASSISHVGDVFTQNYRDIPGYSGALRRGVLPIFRGYTRTTADCIRGSVIEAILCHNRVVKIETEARFGIHFDEYFASELESLAPFADDGLVVLQAGEIQVTPTGRIFNRAIAQVFDAFAAHAVAAKTV